MTHCNLCERRLRGKQTRWCSEHCSVVWYNPGSLWYWLWRQQGGLCGVCCLPMPITVQIEQSFSVVWEDSICGMSDPDIEVDHVVPLASGGSRRLPNLRATHRVCNQGKKAKPLEFYRWEIGAYENVIEERLGDAAPPVRLLLVEPRVRRDDFEHPRPVLAYQTPLFN